MGKGSGGKQRVVEYRMSLHYGVGVADGITEIYIGEKLVWSGDVDYSTIIEIHQPDLFGGIKQEGGVSGLVFVLVGDRQQMTPNGLAARKNLTSQTCPADRGYVSAYFVGNPTLNIDGTSGAGFFGINVGSPLLSQFRSLFVNGVVPVANVQQAYDLYDQIKDYGPRGFYLSANNPYLKSIWIRPKRAARGLDPAKRYVGSNGDINGAHIVYECLTNCEWGMGGSRGIIDQASFEATAETLYNENFGLSMLWTRQSPIESFVSEVLDHIQARLYVNPRNGLLSIGLIRADYDINTLRVINPSNAKLMNFQRKAWGETINEVVVTYTDHDTGEDMTTSAQDLANIAMQGGAIVSDSRNYYAVRNPDLAAFLAARDLAVASTPLASCDVEVDRTFWNGLPGEPMVLTWPKYGIEQLVVRAGQIDYGKPDKGALSFTVVEDIFSATNGQYMTPPPTSHVEDSSEALDVPHVRIITEPAYMLANRLSDEDLIGRQYPDVNAAVLAVKPSGITQNFDLYEYGPDTTGDLDYRPISTRNFIYRAALASDIDAEAETTLTAFSGLTGVLPAAGWFIMIGDDDAGEDETELCLISSVDDDGWTLTRGALDTIPRAWTEDTPIWLLRPDVSIVDEVVRSDGEDVDYKLLSRTPTDLLKLDDATAHTETLTGRPHLPLRPADVTVAGASLASTGDADSLTSIPITWANRNRLFETAAVLKWTDGSATPESGQVTVIRVYDGATLLSETSDLSGASHNLSLAAFKGYTTATVQVLSKRDGLYSLQGASVDLINIAIGSDIACTTEAVTQSASGTVGVSGDAAQSLDPVTQAATAVISVTSSGDSSTDSVTQSASGTVTNSATGTNVLDTVTQEANGSVS